MKKIIIILLSVLPIVFIGQQRVLNLVQVSGGVSYPLESIAKHTFENGKLITTFNDGSPQAETSLNTLSRLTFEELIDVPTRLLPHEFRSDIVLYPMPVGQTLNVNFVTEQEAIALLSVHTLEGRLLISSEQNVKPGANSLKLDVASLSQGIYLCHIVQGANTCTRQIVKK